MTYQYIWSSHIDFKFGERIVLKRLWRGHGEVMERSWRGYGAEVSLGKMTGKKKEPKKPETNKCLR